MSYTIKYKNMDVTCDTLEELETLVNAIDPVENLLEQSSKRADRRPKSEKPSANEIMRAHSQNSFLTKKEEELILLLLDGHTLTSAAKLPNLTYTALWERLFSARKKYAQKSGKEE